MMLRLLPLALCIGSVALAQSKGCATIDADRLEARHLAGLIPVFHALPPETPISPAPAPGARRLFSAAELLAIATKYSLPLTEASDICFEWDLRPLDRSVAIEAMKSALNATDPHIEIIETSLYPVPPGRVEFRREGLGNPADPSARTPVIWRGNIVYGDNRRFSIWARVVLTASVSRVVAGELLKRGDPVRPDQVRVVSLDGFPVRGDFAQSIEEVAGKAPWRDLRPDAPIRLSTLMQLPDIGRGEMVSVEVRAGAARLALTAKAEAAGRSGEVISMRNPSSNRIFTARVTGKGRAAVDVEPSHE